VELNVPGPGVALLVEGLGIGAIELAGHILAVPAYRPDVRPMEEHDHLAALEHSVHLEAGGPADDVLDLLCATSTGSSLPSIQR
jgi:hypothetical protein